MVNLLSFLFKNSSMLPTLVLLEVPVTIVRRWLGVYISVLVLSAIILPSVRVFPDHVNDAAFGVATQPTSVVIKVGDKALINVTIINPEKIRGGQVCFSLEGFPASGFRTSFAPECANSRNGGFGTILTVEATAAAAPQTVTAYVIANSGNQTAQAVLNVTVEFAMPPWIPWLGLLLFFVLLGVAVFWKPRGLLKRTGIANSKQKKR
jgi:hypothetical protein